MRYGGPGVLALSGGVRDEEALTRALAVLQPGHCRRAHAGQSGDDHGRTTEQRRADGRGGAEARAGKAAPPLAIKSVSLGVVRFVVTADGAKYLEGASLANGFVLKAIQEDRLILSNGDQDIIYYFGRG
ncbi:MAG: EscD/YscD/HrpQ family type III secretion system periplasmic domain-containing protein [Gammaproteobacteria bacterium]